MITYRLQGIVEPSSNRNIASAHVATRVSEECSHGNDIAAHHRPGLLSLTRHADHTGAMVLAIASAVHVVLATGLFAVLACAAAWLLLGLTVVCTVLRHGLRRNMCVSG